MSSAPLHVAVVTSIKNCLPRIQACRDTWFKDVTNAGCTVTELDDFDNVDALLGKDSTSRKYERFFGFTVFDPFAWYMLCDDDTYVCYDKLREFLSTERDLQTPTVLGAYVQGRYGNPIQRKLNPKVMCHNGGAGICFNGVAAIMIATTVHTEVAPKHPHMHACDQWLALTVSNYNACAARWFGRSRIVHERGGRDVFLTSKPWPRASPGCRRHVGEANTGTLASSERALKGRAFTVSHLTPEEVRSLHDALSV